jgi:hypothetical protein
MYQVTQSQTQNNIRLIEIVKKYPQLYNSNDTNYKNTVFVDTAWSEVSKQFNEPGITQGKTLNKNNLNST